MRSFVSAAPDGIVQDNALSIETPVSPVSSCGSHPSSLAEMDSQEPDLSADEGLPPDQPSFTSLFPQAIFKSLLFKAINTAQLGSSPPVSIPSSSQGALNPLFAEPTKPVDCIPMPPLFLDVIKKWLRLGQLRFRQLQTEKTSTWHPTLHRFSRCRV